MVSTFVILERGKDSGIKKSNLRDWTGAMIKSNCITKLGEIPGAAWVIITLSRIMIVMKIKKYVNGNVAPTI